MNKIKIMISLSLMTLTLNANPLNYVKCKVEKDNDRIYCTYHQERVNFQKEVEFNWQNPKGKIERTKSFVIPKRHASVYDYRFYNGRTKGLWSVYVNDGDEEFKTTILID